MWNLSDKRGRLEPILTRDRKKSKTIIDYSRHFTSSPQLKT